MASESGIGFGFGMGVSLVVLLVVCGALYGCPQYTVYQQRLTGEAELARAEQNRKIAVQEAQAKRDAAEALAQAEIARAEGVKEANKIIAEGLGGPEGYLRYLWIDAIAHTSNQIIYVPTEGALPMLEAGRLARTPGFIGPPVKTE